MHPRDSSLLFKSTLDDLSSGEETFLKRSEGLISDGDSGGLVKNLVQAKREFGKDRLQVVSLLLLLISVLVGSLLLLHLVAGFLVDCLFENLLEDFFREIAFVVDISRGGPHLLDVTLEVYAFGLLFASCLFSVLDGFVALNFEVIDLLGELGFVSFLLLLFVVAEVFSTDEVFTIPLFLISSNLAALIVVIYRH